MQPEDFPLNPETLQQFVPFDELTPQTRTRLALRAEILRIPENQEISRAVHDSRYTFYLLDGELVLLAGERLVDTLRGGTPICRFPLSRLRSGQLAAKATTTVRLLRIPRDLVSQQLNSDVPAKTAPEPPLRTADTASESPVGILAAMEAVTSPLSTNSGEHEQLTIELARAETEIQSALQDKAEATIARRLWASSFHGLETSADQAEISSLESQMADLVSKQARLEERSRNASEALTNAQRRKLEVAATLRSVEKNHAQQLATTGAGEPLRHQAEAQARNEEQQLEHRYQRISMKLARLEDTRRAAEQRIEMERKQLEERFATTRNRLQKEADDIQVALCVARERAADSANAIGGAQALAQQRVRAEVETRLRKARIQLESEFEQSELALRTAQQELEAAKISKQAAEHEVQQLAARLQAKKTDAKSDAGAHLSRPDPATPTASIRSDESGVPHQEIEEAFPRLLDSTFGADGKRLIDQFTQAEAYRPPEQELLTKLEAIKHKLARADSRVTKAANAKEQAAQVKYQVEEQVARHRAVEDELRVEIYEETEKRLRVQWQRSEEETSASVALVEAMGSRTFASAGGPSIDINEIMMGDIQQQLKQGAPPTDVSQVTQAKTDAERHAAIARTAQENATAERLKAKRDLQRARQHLIELRTRMREANLNGRD